VDRSLRRSRDGDPDPAALILTPQPRLHPPRSARPSLLHPGLLGPCDVILWSYSALNATIWAQSTLSQDELLGWWRMTAPRVAAQTKV
jgi:hypothetical protein